MHEQPQAAMLLDAAADTLRQQVLPLMPAEQRVHVLMVLRAMGIAGREATAGSNWPPEMAERAETLTGRDWRGLAQAIRAGRYDPGQPLSDAVRALLCDLATARCAISNPKALP